MTQEVRCLFRIICLGPLVSQSCSVHFLPFPKHTAPEDLEVKVSLEDKEFAFYRRS